jgi:hypothetical protein
VVYCLLSFEKISSGELSKGIFLKFRGLTSLVVVVVGVPWPKAIPHCALLRVVQNHTLTLYLRLFCTKTYILVGATSARCPTNRSKLLSP